MNGSVRKDFRCDPVSGQRVWRGTWLYVLDLPAGAEGKRRQEKRRGFATRGAAVAALDAARERVRSGTVATSARPGSGSALTVGEYLEGWLVEVRPTLAVTAWVNYQTVLRAYVRPWIGDRVLAQVNEADVSALYRDLLARGGHRRCGGCEPSQCDRGRPLSATTVRLVHKVLRKALFDARTVVPVNPTVGARRPRRSARVMSVWTQAEVPGYLHALSTDRLYAAWFLAVTCGLRRGELAGLRWVDVDLDRRTLAVRLQRTTADWKVVEKEPKGTSRRLVTLGPVTAAVLEAHWQRQQTERRHTGGTWPDTGHVFLTETGEPIHPAALTRRFTTACRAAGVRVIRLHETRHTCATLALAANVHPKVVQERLGHSSVQITLDTYSHTTPGMQQHAADAIETLAAGDQPTPPETNPS